MRVHLCTLGCRLNEAEISVWQGSLRAAGHQVVPSPQEADVIVLNTCAVTAEAARKSRQLARRLHRENPGAKLALTGCFAELEPVEAAELSCVDLVIGNQDKDRLVELLMTRLDAHVMPNLAAEPDAERFATSRTRAFVKVQDGCRNQCSYCVVTIARGSERSVPLPDVVDHVRGLVAAGVREVVLTGVHLGGYGHDFGTSLHQLVQAVLADTDVERLRLSSLEPWDLDEGFWSLWQDKRLCPHLHLPLQSGSDGVLKRMARRCMTGSYRALVGTARDAVPDLLLTTDLIVGFPGETADEWHESLAFVEEIGFGHVHIFAYSPRSGTRAAAMPGQIDGRVKRARSKQAHELAARMKAETLAAMVGTTRDVLWEGQGAVLADGLVAWQGYTDTYVRTETRVPVKVDLENRVTRVELVAVVDGERMLGQHAIDEDRAPLLPGS